MLFLRGAFFALVAFRVVAFLAVLFLAEVFLAAPAALTDALRGAAAFLRTAGALTAAAVLRPVARTDAVFFGAGSALTATDSIEAAFLGAATVRRPRDGPATFIDGVAGSGGAVSEGGGGSIATSPRGRFQAEIARLGSRGAFSPVGWAAPLPSTRMM